MNRVILSAHWDYSCWSLQAITNRLCDWSLANTWWASKQKYHTFLSVNSLVLCDKFKNTFFCFNHTIMAFLKHLSRELDVPKWINSFVPWKPEHLWQELGLSRGLHFIFSVERIDFLLKNLSNTCNHVLGWIEHFLIFSLFTFLVVF